MKLAGCIITDSEENILLLHRNGNRMEWEVPGGKLGPGESSEAAAVREIDEELGVKVELIRKLGKRAFHQDDQEMEYSWYAARILEGEPRIMEPEKFDDLQYLSVDDMWTAKLSTGAWNFLGMLKEEGITLSGDV